MFRAVVRHEGFRKSTLILGGALSAAVHLFLAAAVLLPLSGAPTIARAELDGTPPVLTLDDPTALSVPATAPAVPQANKGALVDAPLIAAPVPQVPVRRPRRPPPLPPPPPDPASELPPAAPPPAAPKILATPALPPAAATTQIVAQPPRAAPAAATRPYLSPGVASGLRIYDNFPRMPEPLRGPGAQYLVMADVCVSERGVVDRVRVSAPAGAAALEHALTDAIRTWRYRPLMTGGGPSPFCHMVNMRYALE
jgi:outer membrane biosynthesis protein TonB